MRCSKLIQTTYGIRFLKKRIARIVPAACYLSFLAFNLPSPATAAESIVMVLQAVNPSDESHEKRPLRQYLPPEVDRKDVLETGGLELRFDEARSSLFLYSLVDLEPGQTKDFRVVLRNVWTVKKDEMDFLRNQVKSRLKYLEGTEDYSAAKALTEHYLKEIDRIEKIQADQENAEVAQRIENHRIYTAQLEEIRQNVTLMGDFVKEARFFEQATEGAGQLRFVVEAKNPLSKAQAGLEIKRYLPQGVRAEHIIEAEGFEILYDPGRRLYYATRKVDLGPKESKRSVITIKNVWQIPEPKLELLLEEGRGLNKKLVKTQYEDIGNEIIAEIEKLAEDIKELQNRSETPLDHISNFTLNLKRYSAIQGGVHRLRELVDEVEHPVPQTVPFLIKPATPDIATTWRVIYGTVIFMTGLGILFYLLWWGQSKSKMGKKYEPYEPK